MYWLRISRVPDFETYLLLFWCGVIAPWENIMVVSCRAQIGFSSRLAECENFKGKRVWQKVPKTNGGNAGGSLQG